MVAPPGIQCALTSARLNVARLEAVRIAAPLHTLYGLVGLPAAAHVRAHAVGAEVRDGPVQGLGTLARGVLKVLPGRRQDAHWTVQGCNGWDIFFIYYWELQVKY